ncbi:MAG: HAD hydrolase family protein, partial [Propionicimonas sp.]
MERKAIFVDVDGTLLTEHGHVPDTARDAIRAARQRGHLVFLCTGRSLGELWGDVLAVGFDGIIAGAGS